MRAHRLNGFTCDAHDLVAPHPESRGSAQAMQNALDMAHLNADQIDLINCHAASTSAGGPRREQGHQTWCSRISHGSACAQHEVDDRPSPRGGQLGWRQSPQSLQFRRASSIQRSTSSSRIRGISAECRPNNARRKDGWTTCFQTVRVRGTESRRRDALAASRTDGRGRAQRAVPTTRNTPRRWRCRPPCRRQSPARHRRQKLVVVELLPPGARLPVPAGPAPG